MADLYLTGEFNDSNEYKWALIVYSIQMEQSETVTFSSVKKDRFAKILLHFFLQLHQLRADDTLFVGNYVLDDKILELFEEYYRDVYEEIREHIADKTYGVTSYLKDCLSGLKKVGLIETNPAVESLISLNTDLIFIKNQEITSKVNISDDIDDLLNLSVGQQNSGRPSVSSSAHSTEYVYEKN